MNLCLYCSLSSAACRLLISALSHAADPTSQFGLGAPTKQAQLKPTRPSPDGAEAHRSKAFLFLFLSLLSL